MNVLEIEQGSIIHGNGTHNVFTTVTLVSSTVGLFLSAAASLLLILTACLYPQWRRNYKNQLLIQLMLARFQYTFVRYFFDIRNLYQLCEKFECIIYLDEYSMIYTEASLVSWMFVFSRHMYESLVKVFVDKPRIVKVSVCTWSLSGVLSALFYSIYRLQNGKDLKFFFIYLGVFKWPVLISNAIILITILKSITKTNENKVVNKSNTRMVVVMIALIFSFCFHQMLIDIYKLLYMLFNLPSYVLLICNTITTYHCAFSIIFWVFGNAKTRGLWKKSCSRCSGGPTTCYQTSITTSKL